MRKIKNYILPFVFVAILSGLSIFTPDSSSSTVTIDPVYKKRVGAICCDDTKSKATGRGACSHHGGVKYWVYDDGSKVSTGKCD